ncbi:unnamed protein product, partial [Mesorhabditis spiculigera]
MDTNYHSKGNTDIDYLICSPDILVKKRTSVDPAYTCDTTALEFPCNSPYWFKIREDPAVGSCVDTSTCPYCMLTKDVKCYTILSASAMASAQIMMARFDPTAPAWTGIKYANSTCMILNSTGIDAYPESYLLIRGSAAIQDYELTTCSSYDNTSSSTAPAYTCEVAIGSEFQCGLRNFTIRPNAAPTPTCGATCAQCLNQGKPCYTMLTAADLTRSQIIMARTNIAALAWTGIVYNKTTSTWVTQCTVANTYNTWLKPTVNTAIAADAATKIWCHAINYTHSLFLPCAQPLEWKILIKFAFSQNQTTLGLFKVDPGAPDIQDACTQMCISLDFCDGVLTRNDNCVILNSTQLESTSPSYIILRDNFSGYVNSGGCVEMQNDSYSFLAGIPELTCPIIYDEPFECFYLRQDFNTYLIQNEPQGGWADLYCPVLNSSSICWTWSSHDFWMYWTAILARISPSVLAWTGIVYSTSTASYSSSCNFTIDYSWLDDARTTATAQNASTDLWCNAINSTDSLFLPCSQSIPLRICGLNS